MGEAINYMFYAMYHTINFSIKFLFMWMGEDSHWEQEYKFGKELLPSSAQSSNQAELEGRYVEADHADVWR